MTASRSTIGKTDWAFRFGPAFADVIHVYADPNDKARGMAGFRCEFSGKRSPWRTSESLADFARKHFGKGRLVKIRPDADGERYVVLVEEPAVIPIRAGVLPDWAYHAA